MFIRVAGALSASVRVPASSSLPRVVATAAGSASLATAAVILQPAHRAALCRGGEANSSSSAVGIGIGVGVGIGIGVGIGTWGTAKDQPALMDDPAAWVSVPKTDQQELVARIQNEFCVSAGGRLSTEAASFCDTGAWWQVST